MNLRAVPRKRWRKFEDLMKTGWGQADAKRIYAAARPSYHAVTVNTLDAIVE